MTQPEVEKRKEEISAALEVGPFISFYKKSIIKRRMTGGDEQPYLIRWTLFSCPWFSVKIHKILVSDEDCLHDHPWSFLSIILKGGYWEFSPDIDEYVKRMNLTRASLYYASAKYWFASCNIGKRWFGPGSILWRPQHYSVHRLELEEPATTLVITFKRVREWGFYTRQGWMPWFKYSSQERCDT